ncbi:MAG: sporulation protein YqfD [Clostridia bacterium]|nr:sporulation protein YqfD [Clostridia bacterium]
MIAERVREFLSGRVVFTATGGFPSLLLEECAVRKTVLRDVEQKNGCVTAWVSEKDYRRVKQAAEKAGMTLAPQKVTGLPLLARRCRARVGVFAGLLAGALLLWYLSGGLWELRVTGNETLGAEEILDALAEEGIRIGARTARLDCAEAERQMQARLPRLSWIAVNITGCRATAEVREATEPPETPPEGEYANVVAARDGVILRADVLSGEGQPKIGEAVVKGDLLVSGVVEMNNGRYRLTEAKAVIEALTKTELSLTAQSVFPAQVPEHRRTVYAVRFFGVRLPLGLPAPEGEAETGSRLLQSRRTVFPVGTERDVAMTFSERPVTLDEDRTRLLCFATFCEQAAERYREAKVLRRSIVFFPEEEGCGVVAKYEYVENIARRAPLPVRSREQ